MKLRISLFLLTVALTLSPALSAHTDECSNVTIEGTYAFMIHGQILTANGPLIIDGIAKTTFDGNGNLVQVDAVAVNGDIPVVWRPGTGTYSVNSDCTGTMTFVSQGQAPIHLVILVSHSGDLIHAVVADTGFAVTSDAERVVADKKND
jgi:hypothetical protein